MVEKKLYCTYYAGLERGDSISGGDNILIELARRWADKLDITIFSGREGYRVIKRQKLDVKVIVCPSGNHFRYLERLWRSIQSAFRFKDKDAIIYTSSDFWQDFIFGLIVKLRYPTIKWVAGCFLVVPTPFAKCSPYKGMARIRGIGYYLTQRPVLFLMNKLADVIYVTSEPERKHFTKKTVVIRGGVNIPEFEEKDKIYDAVFMGRFHYQKGVLELIDIWKKVCVYKPNAKLLMMGFGPLLPEMLKRKTPNIDIFPFAGEETKKLVFPACKIVLHPAIFDSGGMACAEGMSYGLPCVGFDLETYKTYYPKGMLKAKDKEQFANYIIQLLIDKDLYRKVSKNALELIKEKWNWDNRATEVYNETGFSDWCRG